LNSLSSSVPTAASPAHVWRRYLLFVAKVAISILTLGIVVREVSVERVSAAWANIDLSWLLIALVIFWIAQVFSSLRAVFIARTLGGSLSLAASLRAHFIGLWFNQVFPTSLGGDVVKGAVLSRGLGVGLAARTTILDRVSGFLFLLGSIVLLLPAYQILLHNLAATALLGGGALGVLLVTGLLARYSGQIAARFAAVKLVSVVLSLFEDIYRFRRGRPLGEQAWTSLIVHVNGIVTYCLIGRAIGVDVGMLDYFLLTPLVFLVALLPISLAGWGVREVGAVWIFSLAGIQAEQALAMSILFGLLLIVAGLPGLVLMLLRPR
jgi:uncharacterized membrane protein YbhN (UPF0104 family)